MNQKINTLSFAVLSFLLMGCHPAEKPLAPEGMVYIPAGDNPAGVAVDAFFMDKTLVTVAQFTAFVRATGFKTEAERLGDGGVFNLKTGQWGMVKGATYHYPQGPNAPAAKPNHPVTQVSWNDATAYCQWAKKRLPTRAEWEFAANNANPAQTHRYAWGDKAVENGRYKANFWQGAFPQVNTNEDGYLFTSPVGAFGETALGLTDMGGNVWQWVADWHPGKTAERAQCGGSFLCDPAICHGFQLGQLSSSTPETSLMHVGFRCVRVVE